MATQWKTAKTYSDILYVKSDGIAKITINRPAKRNAFRPETITQMIDAFTDAREDQSVGVVLLTARAPTPMASTPSAREATRACAGARATWATTACRASMSSTCSGSSARCRRS